MGPAAAAALDFEALETALRRQVLELAARTVETHLNQDHSDATPSHNCSCGGSARYAGRRTKQFVTVLGPMRLARAYYHCGDCGHGFCPRDRALGLEGSSLSPALMRMVGAVASMVSFQESSQLLEELAGVDVGTKQVQRSAQALGEQVAGYERQTREPDSGLPLPSTLYLGLDGTGVPMRSTEVQGRAGKQPDGSARTREAKLCTVWSAERRAPGRPGSAPARPAPRSLTPQRSRAPPPWIRTPSFRSSPNESSAKANDAVLGKRHGKSSWETERGGSGISTASSSRRRCR